MLTLKIEEADKKYSFLEKKYDDCMVFKNLNL